MNRHIPPFCPSCAAPLPRAAANRCPGCHHVLGGLTRIVHLACRRCGAQLEQRAGAAVTCLRCRSLRPSMRLQPVS